jgi:hypothetical protein
MEPGPCIRYAPTAVLNSPTWRSATLGAFPFDGVTPSVLPSMRRGDQSPGRTKKRIRSSPGPEVLARRQ